MTHDPVAVQSLAPSVPQALTTLVDELMRRDRNQRRNSASDVRKRLHTIRLAGTSGTAMPSTDDRWTKRKRIILSTLAGMSFLMVLVVVTVHSNNQQNKTNHDDANNGKLTKQVMPPSTVATLDAASSPADVPVIVPMASIQPMRRRMTRLSRQMRRMA